MKLAAMANIYAGGSGLALLSAEDPAVSVALQAVAVESAELALERDKRLARYTAAALAGKRI